MRIDPGAVFHQGAEYKLLGTSIYRDRSDNFDVIALSLQDTDNPTIRVAITMAEMDLHRLVTALALHKGGVSDGTETT